MRTRSFALVALCVAAIGAGLVSLFPRSQPESAAGRLPEPEDALQLAEEAVKGDLASPEALDASARLAGYDSNAALEAEQDPTFDDELVPAGLR